MKHEGPRYEAHKKRMKLRRQRQRRRAPDVNALVVYYSKNSLPEYRKEIRQDGI
jgi:hypothetical protein